MIGLALGFERMSRRFWIATLVSFAGVGLVAAGSGASLDGGLGRDRARARDRRDLGGLLDRDRAADEPLHRLPDQRRRAAARLGRDRSIAGAPQTARQDYGVGWEVWALLVFATLGPLVLTNILWFRALHGIGASRATLIANLQPFVAAIFALVLLSEQMTLLQVVGGVLIGGGILLARRRQAKAVPASLE